MSVRYLVESGEEKLILKGEGFRDCRDKAESLFGFRMKRLSANQALELIDNGVRQIDASQDEGEALEVEGQPQVDSA